MLKLSRSVTPRILILVTRLISTVGRGEVALEAHLFMTISEVLLGFARRLFSVSQPDLRLSFVWMMLALFRPSADIRIRNLAHTYSDEPSWANYRPLHNARIDDAAGFLRLHTSRFASAHGNS